MWGILSVACSSPAGPPRAGGAEWGGRDMVREVELPAPLALNWTDAKETVALYRVDPKTMRLHDELPLGLPSLAHGDISPDGSSAIFATGNGRVRVVDLDRERVTLRKTLGIRSVIDVAWVADDAAILVKVGRGEIELVLLRPSTGTVVALESVAGIAFKSTDAGTRLVLLAYDEHDETPAAPAPVTLATMDASGELATARIDEIGAGHYEGPEDRDATRALPALTVAGSRATLVGIDGTIVSVDLTDLTTTVEGENDSFFDALAAWFAPPAHAKALYATELQAEWVSEDALLVSGYRTTSSPEPPGETEPAGALLLDADDWSATAVDEDANGARSAEGLVLAWKVFMLGDERREGIGLRAYDADGDLAWRVLDGQFVRMLGVHRGVAFVEHGWHRVLVSSVDLGTGKVLATTRTTPSIVLP